MTDTDQSSSGARWEPAPGGEQTEAPAEEVPAGPEIPAASAAGPEVPPAAATGTSGGRIGRRRVRRALTAAGLVLVGGIAGLGAGHALAGDGGSNVPGVPAQERGHDFDHGRDGGPGGQFDDGDGSGSQPGGQPPVTGGGA